MRAGRYVQSSIVTISLVGERAGLYVLFSIVITSLGGERAGLYVLFCMVITSLVGERELVDMLLLFVYLTSVTFRLFSLSLGVRGWSRLVIVGLSKLFV